MTTKWWNILISFVKKIKLPYFLLAKVRWIPFTLRFRPTLLYSILVLRIRPYKGSNFLTKWFYTSACVLSHFSCVRLFVTLWTIAHQTTPSMGFSRQEYWRGCHALLQGIFLTQGSNPCLLCLLHWQAGFLSLVPPVIKGSPPYTWKGFNKYLPK